MPRRHGKISVGYSEEPGLSISMGATYIETLILSIIKTGIQAGLSYNEIGIQLGKALEEEIISLSLKDPNVFRLFVDFVKKYYEYYLPEGIVPPLFKGKRIWDEILENLRDQANKILDEDLSILEESTIRERLEPLVALIVRSAAKALFRELGYIK